MNFSKASPPKDNAFQLLEAAPNHEKYLKINLSSQKKEIKDPPTAPESVQAGAEGGGLATNWRPGLPHHPSIPPHHRTTLRPTPSEQDPHTSNDVALFAYFLLYPLYRDILGVCRVSVYQASHPSSHPYIHP